MALCGAVMPPVRGCCWMGWDWAWACTWRWAWPQGGGAGRPIPWHAWLPPACHIAWRISTPGQERQGAAHFDPRAFFPFSPCLIEGAHYLPRVQTCQGHNLTPLGLDHGQVRPPRGSHQPGEGGSRSAPVGSDQTAAFFSTSSGPSCSLKFQPPPDWCEPPPDWQPCQSTGRPWRTKRP